MSTVESAGTELRFIGEVIEVPGHVQDQGVALDVGFGPDIQHRVDPVSVHEVGARPDELEPVSTEVDRTLDGLDAPGQRRIRGGAAERQPHAAAQPGQFVVDEQPPLGVDGRR